MFSLRRKSKHVPEPTKIRGSPSLPEMNNQGIPWPENLVDVSSIRQDIVPIPEQIPPSKGAAPTHLGLSNAPIAFHRPFRPSGSGEGPPSISSLYMSNAPATFNGTETKHVSRTASSKYGQRRTRVPPTFNLMVVGGKGTGKTSLLRLLLETADISPTATVDQRTAVDRFLSGSPKTTHSILTACVEICESKYDRVLFSVIDSPGLDFSEGRELKLDRQVSSIIKYVDTQYADTMNEESKVIRTNKGDQHIHLCIYLIDPSSIMTVADRRAKSALPTKTRSETTVSYRNPPDLIPDTSSESEEEESPLTMSPAEIRVIRRLAARCNVLPVIAKSDSLTDEVLSGAKEAVRRSLSEAGLDFGVFGPSQTSTTPKRARTTRFTSEEEEDEDDGHDEERQSRPVIKLRRPKGSRNLSRSRSRRDLSQAAEDEHRPVSPDAESIANVRFSAHIVAKPDLTTLMPFALIAPENKKRSRHNASTDDQMLKTAPSSPLQQSEDGHAPSIDTMPVPHTPGSSRRQSYLQGPPENLKGIFIRKFRWGTVDVLDPDHCDFAALRTAVLSTHLKVLKVHTREVLYEKYRTEKLLARRATSQITEEQRDRLLEDLGL